MRFIPTAVHGVLDYVMGVVLIAAPWLFGFADDTAATYIPVILGAAVIAYSFFTNYELGVVRAIPMPTHLMLDGLSGAFLAASPWLFNFDERVWIPHLAFGLLEIGAAVFTEHRSRNIVEHESMAQHTTTHQPG